MEKEELTYILGAGASFESYPVVKNFTNRFDYFKNRIMPYSVVQNKGFLKELNNFSDELKSHQSFDTYFKKLFHLGEKEKILTAKKIINLYFLWEQLEFPENSPYYSKFTDVTGNEISDRKSVDDFKKKSVIDSRYDALIAGLLQPLQGKSEFFTKINFISWNYDLNLIASIKNFMEPEVTLNEYILNSVSTINSNVWDLGTDLQVINMNGYFFSKRLGKLKRFDPFSMIDVKNDLYEIKETISLENDIEESDATRINFGWENYEEKEKMIELVGGVIKNSKTVVVIGYTFPLYNRLIDLGYFNSSSLSNTDVYIQDPKANDIVEFLKSDFGLYDAVKEKLQNPAQAPRIHSKINCDSFFIPNNIYNPGRRKRISVLPK